MPTIALPPGRPALAPLPWSGLGAVNPDPEAAERMLVAPIDLAALILAFLGGVHQGPPPRPDAARATTRFLFDAMPVIVAWARLIVARMAVSSVSLTVIGLDHGATALD